jgi:hypothetical protein
MLARPLFALALAASLIALGPAAVPLAAQGGATPSAPAEPLPDTGRTARRIPVTAQALATAFRDSAARTLLLRARAARLQVDSALAAYEAKSYRKATVKLGFRDIGLERTLFRQEVSGMVQWSRAHGAKVTLTGSRQESPLAPGTVRAGTDVPFPYFPGAETVWIGGASVAREEVDESRVVNPIARGSEAYYTYAIGDSVRLTLPGQVLTLRELRVTPRSPSYYTLVGSFWFDEASAQLVRATYRMAAQADLTSRARNAIADGRANVPFLVRQLAFPLRAELSLISTESSLHEGRFWLPRSHVASGVVKLNVGTLPVQLEERFIYEQVNGTLPPAPPSRELVGIRWDTLTRVPREQRRAVVQQWLKAEGERRTRECAAGATWHQVQERYGGRVPVYVEVPCDTAALARSSELPERTAGDEDGAPGAGDARTLGLDLARQAGFQPQVPTWAAGFADGMLRFNRVEGLSAGTSVRWELGAGFVADAAARVGTGDRWVNGELGLARTNGTETWRLAAYAKTSAMNDWGTPFGVPESLLSAFVGRDEGFYARTWGGEVTRTVGPGRLRLFVEGQGNAPVTTRWSAQAWGDDPAVLANVVAREGTWAGAEWRDRWARGVDPRTGRWTVTAKLEGAGGTTRYGRAWVDALVQGAAGPIAATLNVAGGAAAGTLPAQRAFFMGGARTVRGQLAGTMSGDAAWVARAEVGPLWPIARPVVFYDAGWAGPRTTAASAMRPMSGAGIGVTALEGMLRLDVARGGGARARLRVGGCWAAGF